ncbi:MAG: HEAT repeat domain-containing protein [Planctomycetota bacterium]|jgi:HEAT repeat protein
MFCKTGLALCLLLGAPLALGGEPKPSEIEDWVKHLGAEDYAVREEATRKLRQAGAAAREALEKACKSTDPEVSERAGVLLREIIWKLPDGMAGRLGDFAAQFGKYLKVPDEQKLRLLRELRRRAPVEAEPYLLQALKELPGSSSRAWLADLLSIYRSAAAERGLDAISRNKDRYCRSAAATALGHFEGKGALKRLIELAADAEAPVRVAALGALARRGPYAADAFEVITAGLSDGDETVRRAAAQAAGRAGVKGAVEKLWELAARDELAVRTEAVAALGRLAGADDAVEAAKLAGLLNDNMPAVRATAIQALLEMNGRSQAPALAALLGDGDPDIAADAARALGALGGKAEVEKLRKTLRSAEDPSVRCAAGRSLIVLGDAGAPKLVSKMMFGRNATTASVCASVLGLTGDLKWSRELARAEAHWKSSSFRTASLEVRIQSFRDPEAVPLLARELSQHGSQLEWSFFLAGQCLFEESARILRGQSRTSLDDADTVSRLGIAELHAGRAGEGIAKLRLAARMSPFDPVNVNNCAWFLVTAADEKARDYPEGLRLGERAAALRPRTGYIVDTYAWALHRNGRSAEALKQIDRALQWARADNPGEQSILRAHRARILAATGKKREALLELAEILKRWPRDAELAVEAARAYCDLSMPDRGLRQLVRAVELGHHDVQTLSRDPELAAVRREAGYAAMLESAKKAQAAARKEFSRAGPGAPGVDEGGLELELEP